MPTTEALEAELDYTRELLVDICAHFAVECDSSLSVPEIIQDKLLPELKKTKSYKNKEMLPQAKRLFEIWRRVMKKPRSNYKDVDLRMIISLLRSNYTEAQIVQGIIGLSKSEHHMKNGYYHIYYVVRTTNQLEMMIHKAEEHGFTEERVQARLDSIAGDLVEFGSATDSGYVNPSTGKPIK